jgi:hypothetical protein
MGGIESMEHCCSDRSPKTSSERTQTQMAPCPAPQRFESALTAETQSCADAVKGEGSDPSSSSFYMVSETHGTRGIGFRRDELGHTKWSDPAGVNVLQHVKVVPCGVLGRNVEGQEVLAEPKEDTVCVDSAGLPWIQQGLSLMPLADLEAAGSLYRWLGMRATFPDPVRHAITAPTLAKYHEYGVRGERKCIHVVAPDLRSKQNMIEAQGDAVSLLADAYHNVLAEFCSSGAKHLRLAPISEGTYSGPLRAKMPEITTEALKLGFQRLGPEQQQIILGCQVEMCIKSESSTAQFVQALECKSTSMAFSKL